MFMAIISTCRILIGLLGLIALDGLLTAYLLEKEGQRIEAEEKERKNHKDLTEWKV